MKNCSVQSNKKSAVVCGCVCVCGDSSIERKCSSIRRGGAINWAQIFYRGRRPCSSIERKYFRQLHVEVPSKLPVYYRWAHKKVI